MNRKEFLSTTFTAAVGLTIAPSLVSCSSRRTIFQPMSTTMGQVSKIRGNVSTFSNKGGTVGLLETKDSFVVIDAQFTDSIQPLLDSISKLKGKPIEFLCNTHHHADHTDGNFAFKIFTKKIVAKEKVPELQRKSSIERKTVDKQNYANILFDRELLLKSGSEKIKAYHFGGGHTYGDAIYHFESDDVVHMGDLVFVDLVPVFRVKDGANFRNWISILDKTEQTFTAETKFIFGHAPKTEQTVGTMEQVLEMRNFLEASAEYIKKSIAEGKTVDQLSENLLIPKFENRKAINKDFAQTFVEGMASQF